MKTTVAAVAILAVALAACGKRGTPRPPEGAVAPTQRTEPAALPAPALSDALEEDDPSLPGDPLVTLQ